ncbi:MAG: hypothetical protein H9901_01170 [Candidatus Paralactobacillus gallistercoris]|uniref:Uncharacterized protein n=1 Tax=Candidatus Paralactobacillus gallistercoris TaxID=2838724 RepID=A0A948WZ90_9LACO|nr:hypothetical protein [Candidatus Paralactobacillus gallistercoris]
MELNELRTEQDKVWYATMNLVPQGLGADEICQKVDLTPQEYYRELAYHPEYARPHDFDEWVWAHRLKIDPY